MEMLQTVLGKWLSVISKYQPVPGESVPLFDLPDINEEFEAAVYESPYYQIINPPKWYPIRNLLWLFSYLDDALDSLVYEAALEVLISPEGLTAEEVEPTPGETIIVGAYGLLIPIQFKELIRQHRDLIIAHLLQYPWQVQPQRNNIRST